MKSEGFYHDEHDLGNSDSAALDDHSPETNVHASKTSLEGPAVPPIQGSSGSTTLHDDKVSLMFYGYQVLPLIKGQSMRAN